MVMTSDETQIQIFADWSTSINWVLNYFLHRADETQQGRDSCPRLKFLAFRLDAIMSLSRYVFVVLSVLR